MFFLDGDAVSAAGHVQGSMTVGVQDSDPVDANRKIANRRYLAIG